MLIKKTFLPKQVIGYEYKIECIIAAILSIESSENRIDDKIIKTIKSVSEFTEAKLEEEHGF